MVLNKRNSSLDHEPGAWEVYQGLILNIEYHCIEFDCFQKLILTAISQRSLGFVMYSVRKCIVVDLELGGNFSDWNSSIMLVVVLYSVGNTFLTLDSSQTHLWR